MSSLLRFATDEGGIIFESHFLTEGAGAEKKLYVEGVFMQQEKGNRNKRVYPTRVLQPQVEAFIENYVKTNRAVGELEHPSTFTVNPDRVSHRIVEINREGNDYMGKALVLNTPMGNIIKGLVEGGVQGGMSSRGRGTTKNLGNGLSEVQNDFRLSTVDFVLNPSGIDCWVDPILEGELIEEALMADGNLAHEFEQFLAAKQRIKESRRTVRAPMTIELLEKMLAKF